MISSTLDIDKKLNSFVSSSSINKNSREYRFSKVLYRYLVRKGEIIPLTDEQKSEHKRKKPYQIPEVPLVGLSWPKSGKKSRARDRYGPMTTTQKSKLIELMAKGIGKVAACEEVGATLPMLTKACNEDHDFRNQVVHQDAKIDETLDDIVWIKAIDEKDVSAALALRRIRMSIREQSERKKMDKIKIVQKDRELDIKEKSCNVIASSVATSNINVSSLSTDEMNRYLDLMSRASALSADEHTEFGQLTAKMYAQPVSLDVQSNGHAAEVGVKALNGLSRIDQELSDEDEDEE
jgi:hypothetical protein